MLPDHLIFSTFLSLKHYASLLDIKNYVSQFKINKFIQSSFLLLLGCLLLTSILVLFSFFFFNLAFCLTLVYLKNVLILENMIESDFLWDKFTTLSPDFCVLELFGKIPVDLFTNTFDGASVSIIC